MPERRKAEFLTLPNNVRVIMEHIPQMETVSVGIHVGAGSVSEGNSIIGISHFLEHMLFKGTKNRDFLAINRDIEKYGGYLNAYTDKHNTLYYVKIIREYLPQALDVLLDMVCNATFPLSEVEKEKRVIIEEILMYEDNPEDNVLDSFMEYAYPDSYLGWPILGYEERIKKIKQSDLIAYRDAYYQNENIILSICGNFDRDELLATLAGLPHRRVGNFPQNKVPKIRSGIGFKERDVEQAHIVLGVEAFSLYDNRRYILSVLNHVLGTHSSSRLYLKLREELGLCYSVSSSMNLDRETGYMSIFTSTQPDNMEKILGAIKEEIRALKTSPITPEELDMAKAQIKSQLIFNQENSSYTMQKNASQIYWHQEIIPYQEILRQIMSVTLVDLTRMHEEIFPEGHLVTGFAIVPEGAGKKLPAELII